MVQLIPFTVTATNAIGTSAASDASNSVVPVVPGVGSFYGGGVVFYIFQKWRYWLCCRRNPRFNCGSSRPEFWYTMVQMVVIVLQGQQRQL